MDAMVAVFEPGELILVHGKRPVFTDAGLIMEDDVREATFIEHTPKPYDPESCKVDYGNGPRKCSTDLLTPR